MKFANIVITGGAGFVGASLAISLTRVFPGVRVVALDNLHRRGSEFNLPRLREAGVTFVHGDVRNRSDFDQCRCDADLIIDCAAEPSVLAGADGAADYVVGTNLTGTVNALEYARQHHAAFLFLSTSRVYPIGVLNRVETVETDTRYELAQVQSVPGVTSRGVSEDCPLTGARSLYGATKLCSEMLIAEYGDQLGVDFIINRCGVITGPWQMGKVDQGVFALWAAMHYFGKSLSYIGFGGQGKQVRDLLHVDDLCRLVHTELRDFDKLKGSTFNAGGGVASSLSLLETTMLCRELTGKSIPIASVPETRAVDVKTYVTDNARVTAATGWAPVYAPKRTLESIVEWIGQNEQLVESLWAV